MFDGADEHVWFLVVTRDVNRYKWFFTDQGAQVVVGNMVCYFSSSDDFEIVTKLIEDASDREEHEGDIDPKLVQIDVVSYPRLISYHDDDIDEYEEREGTREKRTDSEATTKPPKEDTYYQK